MISAGDLRKGTTFEHEGQVYTVIDFLHVKPGKGAAFVRTKLRNVISGGVTDTTFNPTAKLQEAIIERKEMQYLYSDGELYYFMDQETFEQIPLNYEKVEEAIKFLKENGVDPEIGHTYIATTRALSGQNEQDCMRNIYDLEGNHYEWTAEARDSTRVVRGNFSNISIRAFHPASFRLYTFYSPNSNIPINSSRSTLHY